VTQATLIEVPPHAGNPDENQRFTPRDALAWCLSKTGLQAYDLDVAACREAHHAPLWYGLDHPDAARRDGLTARWWGNVFCNPPWGDIYPWLQRAWSAWDFGGLEVPSMTFVLPGDRTHMPWWQEYVEPFRDNGGSLTTHYPPKPRPYYGHPGNPNGIGCVEPNFTTVVLHWRAWCRRKNRS